MKKYLIVVTMNTADIISYYKSLSRDALAHIRPSNSFFNADKEVFKAFGTKSIDVVDLSCDRIVSGATCEWLNGKIKARRKTRAEIWQMNKEIDALLEKVRRAEVEYELAQFSPAT